MKVRGRFELAGYSFHLPSLRTIPLPRSSPYSLMHALHKVPLTLLCTPYLHRFNPLKPWYDPKPVFTGTSIMTVNPDTGEGARMGLNVSQMGGSSA